MGKKRKIQETNPGYEDYQAALAELKDQYQLHKSKEIIYALIDNITFDQAYKAILQEREDNIGKAKQIDNKRRSEWLLQIVKRSSTQTSKNAFRDCIDDIVQDQYQEMTGLSLEEQVTKVEELKKKDKSFVEQEKKKRHTVDDITRDMRGMDIG
ncbi:hypothetical protein RLOatenuis_4890 [Rickettsiales bacterium]|nr:hypothetical protein RLOatenuis_4890 [Rickettsiales bacterium]